MDHSGILRYLVAGALRREFILLPTGKPSIDIPGGNLLYAAAGVALWETSCGLISRAGEDYPQEWLNLITQKGFDRRGIRILPQSLDLRSFVAYPDFDSRYYDNPVSHFSRLNLQFPKSLLGYSSDSPQLDSRTQPNMTTIRPNDLPVDYFEASAVHLCPLDFLSHSLLPSAFRRGQVTTITLDPAMGYMNPVFWDDIPRIVNGLTAFLTSEDKLSRLYQGRNTDSWEMAEGMASLGCEIIVIKRGARGQLVYDQAGHNRWMIPAYPARVVDPTGAGDAFCGGFLAGYRNTYDPLQAALHGNISASFAVEGSGPFYGLDALPGLAQARLESIKGMVRKA